MKYDKTLIKLAVHFSILILRHPLIIVMDCSAFKARSAHYKKWGGSTVKYDKTLIKLAIHFSILILRHPLIIVMDCSAFKARSVHYKKMGRFNINQRTNGINALTILHSEITKKT